MGVLDRDRWKEEEESYRFRRKRRSRGKKPEEKRNAEVWDRSRLLWDELEPSIAWSDLIETWQRWLWVAAVNVHKGVSWPECWDANARCRSKDLGIIMHLEIRRFLHEYGSRYGPRARRRASMEKTPREPGAPG